MGERFRYLEVGDENSDFDKQSYISDGLKRSGMFRNKSGRRRLKRVLNKEPADVKVKPDIVGGEIAAGSTPNVE